MAPGVLLALVVGGASVCYYVTQLRARVRLLDDEVRKKEAQRQEERAGRTSAEKELRALLQAKLDVSAGYYIQPIATLRSVFHQCIGTPRQGYLAPATRAHVVCHTSISPEALDGLEAFSHVWITFIFHCNTNSKNARAHAGLRTEAGTAHTFRAKVSPPMLKQRMGVFATRTPHRPNPIGITLAKVERVDKAARTVVVSGIDLVDGTPIVDLKPYVPAYDCMDPTDVAVAPWIAATVSTQRSVAWAPEALDALLHLSRPSTFYAEDHARLCDAITQVLAVDVRSVEQTRKMAGRVNHLAFDALDVQYEVQDAQVRVVGVGRR
ncbi:hypothetical protein SPRG_05790 [Saprolegnia parasitica CBS 223.65]|uniref:TsaA-like domain-containing protein n=1 Tax=Saprolegnia parasitica (strain CBS 223.65) TaxID=695850 RepID=A0A067CDS7_SAPPC|nr:hypothetical protein SPRG_05790 [Saprolegnia parasitica CBS 223.65]KDO28919.1 hypothetical protein SPRG_05790 [Saprolegnia parasitica CBS 223.65]|eukprot:XP_012200462.1 hypothetical protein SPRG_05790 [Saprolegnia parasitica CBS 223.65]